MPDLSKIGERDRLKPRPGDEPHWQRLRARCYIGYRPSKRGGKGTWFARAYDTDAQKLLRKALGTYGSLSGNDVFAAAKKDAEAWSEQAENGGVQLENIETVVDACLAYLRQKPSRISEGVFRRHVYSDIIAKLRLDKLRRHHLRSWRERLEAAPALISRNLAGVRRTKKRSKSTVNRDMVPLRAALARVLSPGTPNTEAAWQEALKPQSNVDKRRSLYLDLIERKRLLEAVSIEALPFVRALCLLPLRPGALASLTTDQFDNRTSTLTVGTDKHGQSRQIIIPAHIASLLSDQAKGLPAGLPMFRRKDGRGWNKDSWKGPIKDAAASAGLPSTVTAYTLRHSVITDLIRNHLPAMTVAQISGTSVAMIERHYGHFVREDAVQALASLEI